MNEQQELVKCRCGLCGGGYNLPAAMVGKSLECPHCHEKVRFNPPPPPPVIPATVAQQRPGGSHICATCGVVSHPWASSRGSFLVGLALWFFFLVPGIIYTIWCLCSQRYICPSCRSEQVVLLNSPMGQKLLRDLQR